MSLAWCVGIRWWSVEGSCHGKAKRKADCVVCGERLRLNRASKSREEGVEEKPVEGVPFDRGNSPAGAVKEALVVVIEDRVASFPGLPAVTLPAGIRSVRVTGDIDSQCLTIDGGVPHEQDGREDVNDRPRPV